MRKVLLLAASLLLSAILVFSQSKSIPTGYYNNASGLCGDNLKTALYNIIKGHTSVSYTTLWTSFKTTDKRSDGKVWDMYSNISYTFTTNQCGTYSGEGDCYNREHSFPKSWFNDATPMYSDLYHLYPTDGYVNGRRSNYPFGEVTSPTYTSGNGGKLGSCSYPGYTGTVFEPIDEYKGDFARTYFYMVTRYENIVAGWETNSSEVDAVLDGTSFPAFETWFLNMLVDWNAADPVSPKEISRNDAVYAIQKNRNPFIDHPEYIDAIWVSGCTTNPTVNLSVSTSTATEAAATIVTVTATSSSAVTSAQTVSLAVSGTGITTGDYTLSSSTITIASGATTGSVAFTIVNDTQVESTETATLSISNPSSGLTLGATTSKTVAITDNDVATTVNLSVSTSTATEASATVVTVTATASSAVTSAQTVSLGVSGTGITTGDYTLSSSTITIASGATTGSVTFTIVNDTQVESTETATLTISNPSSGLTLGATTSKTVAITDNDTSTSCATDLIISEYVEGSSSNKYIELYNGTSASISLSNYQLLLFANGATSATTTVTLSGTIASKGIVVYKNSSATKYTGTAISNSAVNFNGDDAIALKKVSTGAYVDIFGRIGNDPGTAWISGSYTTLDKTLVRKASVYTGVITNPTSGFPTLATQWDIYSLDVVSNLGSHTMTCTSGIVSSITDAESVEETVLEVPSPSTVETAILIADNEIQIKNMPKGFNNAMVYVFDISGRQISVNAITETGEQTTYTIPSPISRHGLYIIKIESGKSPFSRKIIY
ncbi:MAG: endonuclease [Salinivirgaceae bacterium]